MRKEVFSLLVILLLAHEGMCAPLFKVFCSGQPLFRGRVDPIVQPGLVSGHVHKVAGASNFGAATATATYQQVYDDIKASPCTTCSIKTVDNSAYWHPDLYYQWPNGSLSLVPSGGLTIYYLNRAGSGDQANPKWKAFPPGFRMTSGNPFRRSFSGSVADKAISFACLNYQTSQGGETNGFPAAGKNCKDGLRMQVHFPQCWDGVNLDSANHQTHVAFPTSPDGGNCPSTHPVRTPNLFFEAFYSVSQFPVDPTRQPFVLSCGDSTGFGFHGDFLNGWDKNVLQAALDDPTCDISNTDFGNNVKKCAPLAQYVQETPAGACSLNRPIPLNEFLGLGVVTPTLPGCNPITGAGPNPTPCSGTTAATYKLAVTQRFHLKSVQNGKYVRTPNIQEQPVIADSTSLGYSTVYVAVFPNAGYVGIQGEETQRYWSASGTNSQVMANRGSVSDWELFQLVAQPNNKVAVLSKRNGKYLTLQSDNTLSPTAATVAGNAQLFETISPAGGGIA